MGGNGRVRTGDDGDDGETAAGAAGDGKLDSSVESDGGAGTGRADGAASASPQPAARVWSLEHRESVYDGFYGIERVRFSHALHGGGTSGPIERELFVRGDVVGVLPHDPATDRVLLVEQFRIGAMHREPDPWLWEIVAGMIDTDETPAAVARREAKEEAGLELVSLEPITSYLASPGASTEEVHLFLGTCDLSSAGGRHGLAEEDEDILARVMPAERAIGMLDTGQVRNALSIIALQWLKLRRMAGTG